MNRYVAQLLLSGLLNGQVDTLWTKIFHYENSDKTGGYFVNLTSDGGYIITGETEDVFIPGVNGEKNIYLIKTDGNGNVTSTFNIPLNSNRNLEKIVDILGKETPYRRNTPLLYIYDDGTVEKRIVIE